MLAENIRALRQSKGMSQEALAQRLHVVRQTVSKWEKGLSVPDADTLVRLSELFCVPVSQLLGGTVEPGGDFDAVAAQLALINEQLAEQARFRRKVARVVAAVAAVLLLGPVLVAGLSSCLFAVQPGNVTTTAVTSGPQAVTVQAQLDGQTSQVVLGYDLSRQLVWCEGDPWLVELVEGYPESDVDELVGLLTQELQDRGAELAAVM